MSCNSYNTHFHRVNNYFSIANKVVINQFCNFDKIFIFQFVQSFHNFNFRNQR